MSQLLEPPPDANAPPIPDYYRAELIRQILAMTSRDHYANIGNNFEWYIAVLVDLARIAKVDVGRELGEELLNVTVRVKNVRAFSVKVLKDLLRDFEAMGGAEKMPGQTAVLGAAAWIVGEYSKFLSPGNTANVSLLEDPKGALEALISPYSQKLPVKIQRISIQAMPKVFSTWSIEMISSWTQERKLEMEFVIEQALKWLEPFEYSADLEVQERAVVFSQMFRKIQNEVGETPVTELHSYQDEATESWDTSRSQNNFPMLSSLAALFGETEIPPVNVKAQRRVPIPEGLDLHTPLFTTQHHVSWPSDKLEDEPLPTPRITEPVTTERRRQEHHERVRDDPFYILSDNRRPISRTASPLTEDDIDSIPIVQFDGGTNLLTPAVTKVKKKKKKAREIVLEDNPVDIAGDEMPENATLSDAEMNGKKETHKGGTNILKNKQAKGLEDIDFEEEERLEKEAFEAERIARLNKPVAVVEETTEEPLLVERVKKKKKKKEAADDGKKIRKKKDKAPTN